MQIVTGVQILNISSGDTNNSIVAQVGDVISQDVESYTAQYIQQVGFVSLPPKAVPGVSGAECIMLRDVQRDMVIGSRDVATQANYGQLTYGETTIYGAGIDGTSQGRVMIKTDGSVTMYTTDDNTAAGNAVYIRVSPKGFEFKSPFGKLTCDESGWHMANNSGARLDLIGNPNPVTGSSATLTGGTVTINSPMIMLGTPVNTALPLPVVYGIVPATAPGIPILGAGVGAVVVAAAASTSVFVGI
jgi:hypothetical protein